MINKNILIFGMVLLFNIMIISADNYIVTGTALLDGTENTFLSSESNRISMIIPALFLIIAIIAFAIDFGAIGVVAGSLISLVGLSAIGIIAVNVVSLTAIIILGIMLIFKFRQ